MGSTTGSERFLTLLRATYVIPAMFSDFLKSTQAFLKVRPWLLWIVIAQANLSGSWCLSAECPEVCETWVMGQIGTHLGNEELNYHTYWKTWCFVPHCFRKQVFCLKMLPPKHQISDYISEQECKVAAVSMKHWNALTWFHKNFMK